MRGSLLQVSAALAVKVQSWPAAEVIQGNPGIPLARTLSVSGSQMSMSMPLRTPISLPLLGAMTGWLPICAGCREEGAARG